MTHRFSDEVTIIVPCKGADCIGVEELLSGWQGLSIVVRDKGYGEAIKEGLSRCPTPYAAMMDADGQHEWKELLYLYRTIVSHKADMVIGKYDKPLTFRWATSGLVNLVASILCGRHVPDIGSGLRIVRMSAVRGIPLPDGFDCNGALTVGMLLRHKKVLWNRAIVHERKSGKSFVRLKDGIRVVKRLYKTRQDVRAAR